MFMNEEIISDCDCFRLSALLNDDGTYSMAMLTLYKDGKDDGYWDNELYLYEKFYPYLLRCENNKEFEDIKLTHEQREDLVEMFKLAIERGYFKDVIDKRENQNHYKKGDKVVVRFSRGNVLNNCVILNRIEYIDYVMYKISVASDEDTEAICLDRVNAKYVYIKED